MIDMDNVKTWTTADFDTMSWYDNHFHGMKLEAGDYGSGELFFDLDYILEWDCKDDANVRFHLAPAVLQFHEVSALKIMLDYASPTAALGPFSIDGIEREIEQRERYDAQIWEILVNWPVGKIIFESSGFIQKLTGDIHVKSEQYLEPSERKMNKKDRN